MICSKTTSQLFFYYTPNRYIRQTFYPFKPEAWMVRGLEAWLKQLQLPRAKARAYQGKINNQKLK